MRRSKEQWQALIAEQQSSGLSAVEYCRQHGISPKYFSTRKVQLQRECGGSGNFVQVTPKPTPESQPLPFTKMGAKQPRIRVIDIELGDALNARSLSLMLDQVLS
jgi:hypothetical protein